MQIAQQPADQRRAQQRGIKRELDRRLAQREPRGSREQHNADQHCPPIADQKCRQCNHHAREQRQLLADGVELFHHLRHDEDHQRGDHRHRHDREHAGIGKRGDEFAANFRLSFEQCGQPLQDGRQRAGTFACRHHRHIKRRKALGLARHRLGQPAPLDNAGMHTADNVAHMRLFGLAGDGAQAFLDRADLVEGGELAGKQGQLLPAHPCAANLRENGRPPRFGR